MRVTIQIQCDNDAFSDYPEGEIARILTEAARKILTPEGQDGFRLRDANGNHVGALSIQDDK